jgi:hypothetical protein
VFDVSAYYASGRRQSKRLKRTSFRRSDFRERLPASGLEPH